MPTRRRIQPLRNRHVVDPVSCFIWSLEGLGLESLVGDPVFRDVAESRRAWAKYRRAVWAETHRFKIPDAAKAFDGLTNDGRDVLLSAWESAAPFDVSRTLQALAADHAALNRFVNTPGGRSVSDYLEIFRADLLEVERVAREVAAGPQPHWFHTKYPGHQLSTAQKYGLSG